MNRKVIYLAGLCVSLFLATSCGPSPSKYAFDAKGFAHLQEDLKTKFGNNAYYSNISVVNVPGNLPVRGTTLTLTVIRPGSSKMEEWSYSAYTNWKQVAEITIEASEDACPKESMFQLTGSFDLGKIARLVEQSAEQLAERMEQEKQEAKEQKGGKEKEEIVWDSVILDAGGQPASAPQVLVSLKYKHEGTGFVYRYNLDGSLISLLVKQYKTI
ncbi:MAG: hypothetical protein LBG30_07365 [Odoribacteraceae bacterium]|jgi:hypothetical protein|nr:hypothetical protein [Odoribacteraceae bacterium]